MIYLQSLLNYIKDISPYLFIQCIILDEPTAMLDPNGRKEVIATLHELNQKEGITVLLITHYMEEAIDADRIIVMATRCF